jgi:hypothetical protein
MQHVVEESKRIYHGTAAENRFQIFHDGLTQWWEPDAQAYLANVLQFPLNRQLRCEGSTNQDNRYHCKVVGDSPELCRGLDSHGFADLKRQLNWAVALSSIYSRDDPRRFKLGTPTEVASALRRAWQMEPTSQRIVEDILAFRRVLLKIVDVHGCVVPDEFLRSGRRYMKVKGEGDCKNKPKKNQRKDTLSLPPIHPDCVEAFHRLSGTVLLENAEAADLEANLYPLHDFDDQMPNDLGDKPV